MRSSHRRYIVFSLFGALLCAVQARGQAGSWPMAHSDPGHTGWQKAEKKLSKDTVPTQFKFLWKTKLGSGTKGSESFSEPLLAPGLISAKGFKDVVLWASNDTVYAVDYELATVLWTKHYDIPTSNGTCATGPLGILIEPRHVINFNARRVPGSPPPSPATRVPAGSRRLGQPAGGGGFGFRGLYVLTPDGYLHEQVLSTGADFAAPVRLLPFSIENSNGLNVDGQLIYTATKRGCGDATNALWTIDVSDSNYPVTSYRTDSATPLVTMGPTLSHGMAYLVTGSAAGDSAQQDQHPNSIVALTGNDLKVTDWYTPGANQYKLADITPVAFTYKEKNLVAAPGDSGSFVLLDSESLGGSDHRTPLFQTPAISQWKAQSWGAMTSWEDSDGTSWLLASVDGPLNTKAGFETANGPVPHGSIVAFKVDEKEGKTVLTPAWSSRDLVNPSPAVVANGLVFALSEGDAKTHAKLYVLDGATGKELWSSGSEVVTYAKMSGVSVGDSHVFFTTHDGTLYSFGIDIEH